MIRLWTPTTYAGYASPQVVSRVNRRADELSTKKVKKESELMYKVAIAIVLAAGLMAAPAPHLISVAAAQKQSSMPDKSAAPKKQQSAGQLAARERQKKCAAEWKETKATGKMEKGATWPKFWSACNKRLKAAAK